MACFPRERRQRTREGLGRDWGGPGGGQRAAPPAPRRLASRGEGQGQATPAPWLSCPAWGREGQVSQEQPGPHASRHGTKTPLKSRSNGLGRGSEFRGLSWYNGVGQVRWEARFRGLRGPGSFLHPPFFLPHFLPSLPPPPFPPTFHPSFLPSLPPFFFLLISETCGI